MEHVALYFLPPHKIIHISVPKKKLSNCFFLNSSRLFRLDFLVCSFLSLHPKWIQLNRQMHIIKPFRQFLYGLSYRRTYAHNFKIPLHSDWHEQNENHFVLKIVCEELRTRFIKRLYWFRLIVKITQGKRYNKIVSVFKCRYYRANGMCYITTA